MPVSWKGRIIQYVGRLHREHEDKEKVIGYDYLYNMKVIEKMYNRRLKGYKIAGYDLKDKIKKYLEDQKYEVIDLGTNNNSDSVSYSEYGKKLAKNVLNDKGSYGIGVCGTGLGISYSVNRFKGIS